MKIALYVIGGLVALVLVVVAIGYTLPQAHTVTREQAFAAGPDQIFAVIGAPQDYPKWRSDVKSVDLLPPVDGKQRFREHGSNGAILFEIVELHPPRRLVTRIADPALPFGGTWTFELLPTGSGTTLRVTEDGEVYNPLFRFMSRFVFGHTATLDAYLAALARRVT